MQTGFSLTQLANPQIRSSEEILRACVHCGFCTATCPTYVLLGDERDSPRGRIYFIKEMLEQEQAPTAEVVQHVDRCLSCLACMTTCPSGVNYMHLVDHGRAYVEEHYQRPLMDRLLRRALGLILPRPGWFRLALQAAQVARPFATMLPARLRAMLSMVPATLNPASPVDRPQVFPPHGERRKRVALLTGCAQQVVGPEVNEATIRLLTRHGCEVVVAAGAGCCGALTHHLGQDRDALSFVRANIAAWTAQIDGAGLDAIIVNASGCGTMVKDYGFLLRDDPLWAARAARVSALAKDVTEVMAGLGLRGQRSAPSLKVAYHSACSLQHGQRINEPPRQLLRDAGFEVVEIPEGHLCYGSAGTYNLLQQELAMQLRDRKLANIASTGPDVIAAGNIGCMMQIRGGTEIPIVHTVELLDWATGGPKPHRIAKR